MASSVVSDLVPFLFLTLDLLEIYCRMFISPSKSVNPVLVSRIILTLVNGCCMQTEGFHNTLFRFFSRVK